MNATSRNTANTLLTLVVCVILASAGARTQGENGRFGDWVRVDRTLTTQAAQGSTFGNLADVIHSGRISPPFLFLEGPVHRAPLAGERQSGDSGGPRSLGGGTAFDAGSPHDLRISSVDDGEAGTGRGSPSLYKLHSVYRL